MTFRLDRRVGVRTEGKRIDGLLFVVLENVKILGGQVLDVVALLVRHHNVHAYFAGFRLDRASSRGLLLLCSGRGWFLLRGSLRLRRRRRRRLLRAYDSRRMKRAPAKSAGSNNQEQHRKSRHYASPLHFSPS